MESKTPRTDAFARIIYELSNGFTLYICEGCYVLKQEEFNSTLKINSFSESDWKKI